MRGENEKYFKIAITIIITYIGIKFIDNYKGALENIKMFTHILTPFIIAFVFAYMFNLVMKFIEKKFKLKRWISLLIIYGGIISMFIGFVMFVAPALINNITDFVKDIPKNVKEIEDFTTKNINNLDLLQNADIANTLNETINTLMPKIGNFVQVIANGIMSILVGFVTYALNIVFALIISFYILLQKESFIDVFKKFLCVTIGKKYTNILIEFGNTLNSTIGRYIVAALIDSTCVGIVSSIGLSIIGAQYAVLLGCIIGITNLIPYFGPFIGIAVTVIINLFYSPIKTLWCLIFLLILQQIEGNVIAPNFVGGQVGINPFLTLLAVTIGGSLFGIVGMLLAVPVMGVIKIYFMKLLDRKERA